MSKRIKEVIIPREKAVFRLDGQGYWRNQEGRFRNKKIIDHFHRSISRDESGYFVSQDKGGIIEKVYFPCEDTAFFVFDVIFNDDITLVLNTGRQMPLMPGHLFTKNDNLYIETACDRIKFTVRALMKISGLFEESGDSGLAIRIHSRLYPIPERADSEPDS